MHANRMFAGYLFQPDKHYGTFLDTGDKTIQCGRHIDILKLWNIRDITLYRIKDCATHSIEYNTF